MGSRGKCTAHCVPAGSPNARSSPAGSIVKGMDSLIILEATG